MMRRIACLTVVAALGIVALIASDARAGPPTVPELKMFDQVDHVAVAPAVERTIGFTVCLRDPAPVITCIGAGRTVTIGLHAGRLLKTPLHTSRIAALEEGAAPGTSVG